MRCRFKIVNIIAVSTIGQKIDLAKLTANQFVSYDKQKYGGRVAYIKTNRMAGKVSVFNSGKMISAGTKSPVQAKEDMKEATILLKNSLNVNISCEHLTIANIVALVHLEKELDLETILNSVPRAIYEPEQFPGLMLRLAAPTNATVLLFSSGKAIITGLRSEQSAQVACDELFSLVKEISNT